MSSKNDLVIFGALGDLSNRKLFPALYQLDRAGLLDDSVRIAALARDDVSTPVFIEQLQVVLAQAFGETTFGETTLTRRSGDVSAFGCTTSKLIFPRRNNSWCSSNGYSPNAPPSTTWRHRRVCLVPSPSI